MFMNRFWRIFRFGVLLIAFIALGVYLFGTTDWKRKLGWVPKYPEYIQEGQPLVDAVYRFKNERGLWPEDMQDLAPAFLPREQVQALDASSWLYEIQLDGRPGLSKKVPDLIRTHVGFDFDSEKPAWIVFGTQDNRQLKPMNPPPPASTLPADTLLANQLAELDRRIARSAGPFVMGYFRDKVSLLRAAGKMGEARRELDAAQELNVHHFWPRLARVKLDLEQPGATSTSAPASATSGPATASAPASRAADPAALLEFDAWVRAHPSFTHWYYLALAYRWVDRNADALAAMEKASRLTPELGLGDDQVRAFYLWDMTRFALQQRKYPLVLALTDAWSTLQAHPANIEYSYLPLAAAAKLATGDVEGAKALMKKLGDENPAATWADNVEALERAIKRGDRSFVYDPGSVPHPYEVFSRPQ